MAEPGRVELRSGTGTGYRRRDLAPGLHLVVNSGLAGELRPDAGEHEIERIGYFQARLATIPLPQPKPGVTIEDAWSGWLPLLNGAGLSPDDPRALIVRRDLGDGRIWGTTSISLVALTPDGIRYDFTARPGDPAAWYPVPLEPAPLDRVPRMIWHLLPLPRWQSAGDGPYVPGTEDTAGRDRRRSCTPRRTSPPCWPWPTTGSRTRPCRWSRWPWTSRGCPPRCASRPPTRLRRPEWPRAPCSRTSTGRWS